MYNNGETTNLITPLTLIQIERYTRSRVRKKKYYRKIPKRKRNNY